MVDVEVQTVRDRLAMLLVDGGMSGAALAEAYQQKFRTQLAPRALGASNIRQLLLHKANALGLSVTAQGGGSASNLWVAIAHHQSAAGVPARVPQPVLPLARAPKHSKGANLIKAERAPEQARHEVEAFGEVGVLQAQRGPAPRGVEILSERGMLQERCARKCHMPRPHTPRATCHTEDIRTHINTAARTASGDGIATGETGATNESEPPGEVAPASERAATRATSRPRGTGQAQRRGRHSYWRRREGAICAAAGAHNDG